MDTDSFIVYAWKQDIYKDTTEDVETRFDTSNYELECNSIDRPLPKEKKMNYERWIMWKNYYKICWSKSKNL